MAKIRIDGTLFETKPRDYDGDGKADNNIAEVVPLKSFGETEIITPTELGESLKELNVDTITNDTKMSGIDMRARLHPVEITALLALDAIVGFRFLPQNCLAFTRQKKRLSVSIDGKGRQEMVNLVVGKREADQMKGLGQISSVFNNNSNQVKK